MALALRPLRIADEQAALAGHIELREEAFEFLLGWDPDQTWAGYVQKLADRRRGIDVAPGLVPATFLAADLDGALVGRVSIRHHLNEFLENFGGHIGYAVRPAYRGRGTATEILRQALIIARAEGIDDVLLTCDVEHVVSAHIIERSGGVLDDIRTDLDGQPKRRYWIRPSS
jgi:predicted acetyltransferase